MEHNMDDKLKKLEDKLARIERIAQLPTTATLADIIRVINKITDSTKR